MANTNAQRLEEVRRVIDSLLKADGISEVSSGGVTWKRTDLTQLLDLEERLESKQDASASAKTKRNQVVFEEN